MSSCCSYSVHDVVLPLPGTKTVTLTNPDVAEVYSSLMARNLRLSGSSRPRIGMPHAHLQRLTHTQQWHFRVAVRVADSALSLPLSLLPLQAKDGIDFATLQGPKELKPPGDYRHMMQRCTDLSWSILKCVSSVAHKNRRNTEKHRICQNVSWTHVRCFSWKGSASDASRAGAGTATMTSSC